MRSLLMSLAVCSLVGVSFAAETNAVKIEKMMVGTAIENRELTGTADTFDAAVPRLYCWTRLSATQTPATIKHIWSVDGKKEAEVALSIPSASGRTWSSKSVWPGAWKVDAVDTEGSVLQSVSFTVSKP